MTVVTGDKHPNGHHGMAAVLLDPAVSPFPPLSSFILFVIMIYCFTAFFTISNHISINYYFTMYSTRIK
jgi:hypothetical protein